MRLETLKLKDIKPYEKNPRMNDNAVEKVAKSIEEYGYRSRIIVDKNHVIIAGHTRKKALERLGWKECEVWVADDLTADQARALRIADNKTNDFSIWDNKLLLEELEELKPLELFTGFDYTSIAEELDLSRNDVVVENEGDAYYEVVFKSYDMRRIDKIKQMWEAMTDETNPCGGDIGEETGDGATETDREVRDEAR